MIKLVRRFGTDFIDEAMTDSDVLSQIFIEEYSSSLEIKGALNLEIGENTINYSKFIYGTALNSETLKKAKICGQQAIKKIVTVENKVNFVSMPFEENTLIVFCHGYFTPLEKKFLIKLYEVLCKYTDIEYYHTGDLDYGGIKIFQYNKRVFPELKPLNMDIETFEKYIDYAEPIKNETLLKLKNINEPLLNNLIDKIFSIGKGIEQENFISVSSA